MKAQLVKHSTGYILFDEKGIPIGTTPNVLSNGTFSKLSLKNCQAIERGYDLDELVENHLSMYDNNSLPYVRKDSFLEGAKAILEILGDKKFSELDMENCWKSARQGGLDGTDVYEDTFEKYIKSIQQTDWDVEIEIDPTPLIFMGRNVGKNLGILPDLKPKLDSDGCLILKRI